MILTLSRDDLLKKLTFPEVRTAAAGRWESIHRALGVAIPNNTKHTACPGCGGKDRFRLDTDYQNSGRWICGGGGDFQQGDGFSLLAHVHGWTLAESLRAVADHLGLTNATEFERAAIRRKAEEQAARMAEATRKREEMERAYSNMLDVIYDLEDGIKAARHQMRQVSGITSGKTIMTPPPEILDATKNLITTAIDSFGEYMQQNREVNHA